MLIAHRKLPPFFDPGLSDAFFAFCAFFFTGYKASKFVRITLFCELLTLRFNLPVDISIIEYLFDHSCKERSVMDVLAACCKFAALFHAGVLSLSLDIGVLLFFLIASCILLCVNFVFLFR